MDKVKKKFLVAHLQYIFISLKCMPSRNYCEYFSFLVKGGTEGEEKENRENQIWTQQSLQQNFQSCDWDQNFMRGSRNIMNS